MFLASLSLLWLLGGTRSRSLITGHPFIHVGRLKLPIRLSIAHLRCVGLTTPRLLLSLDLCCLIVLLLSANTSVLSHLFLSLPGLSLLHFDRIHLSLTRLFLLRPHRLLLIFARFGLLLHLLLHLLLALLVLLRLLFALSILESLVFSGCPGWIPRWLLRARFVFFFCRNLRNAGKSYQRGSCVCKWSFHNDFNIPCQNQPR
jgi:hypothetical protein